MFEEYEAIIASANLTDDERKKLEKLIKLYKKDLSRFDKVMKQSDRLSTEIADQKESLQRQKEFLERLSNKLSKYLSPQIYDMLFSDEQEHVKLTSQRKKLTVFFSDIAGFTSTTENLEAEELTFLLNRYLTEMSNIALKHGATIDKYIGDAILIFFGDPVSKGKDEDALACVRMAIEMLDKVAELRHEFINSGTVKDFNIRIGINTGYCTVGNFGSDDRMDYTIIGSPVNLASRLESASEKNQILISHETYSLIKNEFDCTEKDKITAKGFDKPIPVYQVDGYKLKEGYQTEINKRGLDLKINTKLFSNKQEIVELLKSLIDDIQKE